MTQEILVRTVTRLSQFDFRSKLKTWVYRIAVNCILHAKKSPVERPELFRKRLQHARAAIESFTREYCGLASDG